MRSPEGIYLVTSAVPWNDKNQPIPWVSPVRVCEIRDKRYDPTMITEGEMHGFVGTSYCCPHVLCLA